MGPAALLGVSGVRKPLPTGSPSWGSRIGRGKPSAPRPQACPLSQLGLSALRPRRTDGPKQSSGSCILQRETLLGQQTTAPTRLGSRKQRKSFSPTDPALHRAKRGWAALAPWALLNCWGSPVPETHSPRVLLRGEAGVGRKMPSGRRPQQSPRSQLESSARRPYLTLRSKLHAGSCIRESSTLLGEQTTAPMRLCSAKQRLPFSPLDPWSP